jgi:2-polyprenyl-3-methyl-5-hydroxy-6-metoxy-1,4-benzoquinol methylase
MTAPNGFDYSAIPEGYYDEVLRQSHPIRKSWHLHKFDRIVDFLPAKGGPYSILDIGCFAGSFLGMLSVERFTRQLGVDILPPQIGYANRIYGGPHREFRALEAISQVGDLNEQFDFITLIEVIEHLSPAEIIELFSGIDRILKPSGRLILSTPNYFSTWPVLEWILNQISEVSYQEQHITKFTYFFFEKKISQIVPGVWNRFDLELKTTTHFISPFLAAIHEQSARKVAKVVPHETWKFPFGNLLIAVLEKKPVL